MKTSLNVSLIPLLLCAALVACGGSGSRKPGESEQMDLSTVGVEASPSPLAAEWHRDAVFMEIYVRGYADSDGDGIGDIDGLISKLDYLADLGVRGIWLMPIFASGDRDHGYDPADHRKIETELGDEAALKRLLDAAHARGIGVILDYVMNHGSTSSPLFRDALNGLAYKKDWFVWRTEQPDWFWMPVNPWREDAYGRFYYAPYAPHMPDFNLRNEDVVGYHLSSMRKWLNLGVDGFRMDAVQAFIENDYLTDNQPETFELLKRIQNEIHRYPNRFMVCENPTQALRAAKEGCDSAFYFGIESGLHKAMIASARNGVVDPSLASYLSEPDFGKMSTLLTNHDTFAGDRLYKQLEGNEARYATAVTTLLTLPGIPFIYYGDEVGMSLATAAEVAHHDQSLRPPMSWSGNTANAGFTSGTPFRALADNVATHNVAQQQGVPGSLLSIYKRLIALRNAEPALRRGDIQLLASGHASVLSFIRQYGSETMLVTINYGSDAAGVTLTLPQANANWSSRYPDASLSLSTNPSGQTTLMLAPNSAQLYKLIN